MKLRLEVFVDKQQRSQRSPNIIVARCNDVIDRRFNRLLPHGILPSTNNIAGVVIMITDDCVDN